MDKKINKEAPYGYKKDGTPRKIPNGLGLGTGSGRKKKKGRPKGSTNLSSGEIVAKIPSIIRMMSTGVSKVTNELNKKKGIKKYSPLTAKEACLEIGMEYGTFMYHLKKDKTLSKMYKDYRQDKQEMMRFVAEDNVSKGLEGELDLSDKDKVDLSLKVLERTDKAYNPKIEIEQTTKSLNFNVDVSVLERQLKELINL